MSQPDVSHSDRGSSLAQPNVSSVDNVQVHAAEDMHHPTFTTDYDSSDAATFQDASGQLSSSIDHHPKVNEKDSSREPSSKVDGTPQAPDAKGSAESKGVGQQEDGSAELPEDESQYPKGLQLALITTGLLFATFVVALDTLIVATAIPRITSEFHSLKDVGWHGSAYLLTLTSFQTFFGKLYTYFNIKRTFLISLVIFEVSSIICATAPSSIALIVGRAVAGIGASGLFSGALTIIGYSLPLRRRAIYIALLTSMYGVSSVVGPIIGGAFTDRVTWRWCFWINLPYTHLCLISFVPVADKN